VSGGEQSEVPLEAISRNERKSRYRNFVTGREGVSVCCYEYRVSLNI